MLIKVFGIWLMASNIQYLSPDVESSNKDNFTQKLCYIKYADNNTTPLAFYNYTCDEVAAEINKQLKAMGE